MNSIKIASDISNLSKLTDFIESNIKASVTVISQLCLIVDEIFSNVAFYSKSPETELCCSETTFNGKAAVCLTFKDSGVAFNPLEKKDPDVTLSAEDRKIGGLGIFLVKNMSDSVFYAREKNCNVLTVIKVIE